MGAISLHVFAQAFGRASTECMKRKCALFLCIGDGLRQSKIRVLARLSTFDPCFNFFHVDKLLCDE